MDCSAVKIGKPYQINKYACRGTSGGTVHLSDSEVPFDSRPYTYVIGWDEIHNKVVHVVKKLPTRWGESENVNVYFSEAPEKVFTIASLFLQPIEQCICPLSQLMLKGCDCDGD